MSTPYLYRLSWILGSLFVVIAMTGTARADDSGIEGVIYVSPSHGGPQREDAPSKAPVANTAFVIRQGDEKVTSFKTDEKGHFKVNLPPGHYVISREGGGPAIGHWRFEVEVATGKMATVNWTADSGMR